MSALIGDKTDKNIKFRLHPSTQFSSINEYDVFGVQDSGCMSEA